jgi:hypothetical protein
MKINHTRLCAPLGQGWLQPLAGTMLRALLLLCVSHMVTLSVWAAPDDEPELSSEYLSLVMRNLYRWHLDETALLAVDDTGELEFLMRFITPELDADDQSRYIELLIPQLSYAVTLKKADYRVPELDIQVQNADYRIIKTEKVDAMPEDLSGYTRTTLSKKDIMEYLFKMRSQRDYPDEALIERMRSALRDQYASQTNLNVSGPQTVYIAPISRVSNNLWVYWENAGRIIRFSSDADLASKAFWAYEKLGVRMYDLKTDVVISMAEAAGSNAYVTRDWAARVLFNCVVFGQRATIHPKTIEE